MSEILQWAGVPVYQKNDEIQMDMPARVGHFKKEGSKERFGFIVELQGSETFVHKNDVAPTIWREVRKGQKIRFEIQHDDTGRTRAKNISLAE